MPQPLSRVRPDAEVEVYPGALHNEPQFAAAAMQVIALWADIDGNLAGVLANTLHTDIAAGAAMYQALYGGEARRLVLLAAADANLSEWEQLLLRAVLKAIKPSRDQRNDFAHNVWGSSPNLRRALLLLSPEVVTKRNLSYRQRIKHLPNGRGVIAPRDFDRRRIQVYRSKDFERAIADAKEASGIVNHLYGAIGYVRNEQSRRALLNEPLVQRALEPLIREKSPEVQAQLHPPGDDPPAPGIWEMWDRSLGRIK